MKYFAITIGALVGMSMVLNNHLVNGAVSQGDGSNADHPGKCYISENEIYEPGTHYRANGCARIECTSSGYYSTASCGVVLTSDPCTIDYTDNGKDYPDCCPRVICPE